MPSSHTQLIFFAFVTYMLLITRTPASSLPAVRWQRAFHMAQGAVLGLVAFAVAYSRIYLGYHTISQVRALATSTSEAVLHPEPFADVIRGRVALQRGLIAKELYITALGCS